MGILKRFTDIMKSNINDLLDKCENPAKMADQMLIDAKENLADVKKETAKVMANEKAAERRMQDCQKDIDKYTLAAQNALKSGKEDDAKKLISKKQQLENQFISLKENYDIAHRDAEQMHQMHDKLVSDIEELELRKESVKAKVATAKAQQSINKVASGANNITGNLSAFGRMEDKANKMLDSARAEADLNAGTTSSEDLADRYAAGCSSSVDDELAKMKADLGI